MKLEDSLVHGVVRVDRRVAHVARVSLLQKYFNLVSNFRESVCRVADDVMYLFVLDIACHPTRPLLIYTS